MLSRSSGLNPFSAKRLAEIAAAGERPFSTFRPSAKQAGERKPAKGKQRPTTTSPDKLTVDAVLDRDQYSCVVCGNNLNGTRGIDWSVHHRRPKGMGGDTRPDTHMPQNLIAVCGGDNKTGCHGWIHSRADESGDQGFLLSKVSDPLTQPMAAWYGAVFLLADGKLRQITEGKAA